MEKLLDTNDRMFEEAFIEIDRLPLFLFTLFNSVWPSGAMPPAS